MSNSGRVCVVFKPAYGKNAGDISRNLSIIETVIRGAGGGDLGVHPHDSAALYFSMPGGTGAQTAEAVVNCLNKLTDEGGGILLEAEQGTLSAPAGRTAFGLDDPTLQFS